MHIQSKTMLKKNDVKSILHRVLVRKVRKMCLFYYFFVVTMLMGNKSYTWHLTGSIWSNRSSKHMAVTTTKSIAWQRGFGSFFMYKTHTQLYSSSHKYRIITNVAPLKREINKLYIKIISIRFISIFICHKYLNVLCCF